MGAMVELASAGEPLDDPVVEIALPAGKLVADRRRAILRIDGIGSFEVEDGSRVRMDLEPGVEPDGVAIWLHGTVAALLLAQRGRFALHASVVDVGGRAVALAGPRGAGKSTGALRLSQRGHRLVGDDVCPLDPGPPVTVHPFARSIRVSPETARGLDLDVAGARPVVPRHPKLALPTPPSAPVPLAAVVVLATGTEAGVDTALVRGARSHWLVEENLYRIELLRGLWQSEMFAWAGAIAGAVPVHQVTRGGEGWTVDAVADAVERVVYGS
jgi:hypothetical protein